MSRKTGQVIQKGGNTWTVRIYLGEDAAGKRRYFNKTVKGNKRDAQKTLTAIMRDMDLGNFVEPSNQKLNEFLDRWLLTAVKPRVSAATHGSYETLLRVHVRSRIGELKISAIKLLDVERVYSEMQELNSSSRTVRYVHTILSMAMRQAIKWGNNSAESLRRCTVTQTK